MILSTYNNNMGSRGFIVNSSIAFLAIAFLLKISVVSSVAEDYYNPDYDEDEILNQNNWGGFAAEVPAKRYLGALARGSAKGLVNNINGLQFSRNTKSGGSSGRAGFGNSNIHNLLANNPPAYYFDSPDDANDDSVDHEELNPNSLSQFMQIQGETPVKGKRFLGSLARGGWFPRQFRGVEKKHIGSAARLGWIRNRESDFTFKKKSLGSLRKSTGK